MEEFETWAKENGIKTFGITVNSNKSTGNGLYSKEKIEENVKVAEIPSSLVLTASRVLTSEAEFGTALYEYFMKKYDIGLQEAREYAMSQDRVVLRLFLIYYRFFSTKSKWAAYMGVLPTIEFFKKNHVLFNPHAVSGTCLEKSVRVKVSSLKRELEELSGSWLSKIEIDMYLWADCTFWSRAVGVGEGSSKCNEMALVPFFDFANHSLTESNIRWELTEEEGLVLVTTSKVEGENKELRLFYGTKSNQELLFLHGFSIENNPEPSRITISLMPFFDFSYEEDIRKAQWLKSIGAKPMLTLIGYSENEELFVEDGWTMESVAVMYLISLTSGDGLSFSDECMLIDEKPVKDLSEFYDKVKEMDILVLIQLRVTILLTQRLEQEYDREREDVPEGLGEHISVYREEELDRVQKALDKLREIQTRLSNDKLVLSYLE